MADKKSKSPYWSHVLLGKETKQVTCKYCKHRFAGGATRIKAHLFALSGVSRCPSVPPEAKEELIQFEKGKAKASEHRRQLDDLDRITGGGSPSEAGSAPGYPMVTQFRLLTLSKEVPCQGKR